MIAHAIDVPVTCNVLDAIVYGFVGPAQGLVIVDQGLGYLRVVDNKASTLYKIPIHNERGQGTFLITGRIWKQNAIPWEHSQEKDQKKYSKTD